MQTDRRRGQENRQQDLGIEPLGLGAVLSVRGALGL
jgi:hypothetical protein